MASSGGQVIQGNFQSSSGPSSSGSGTPPQQPPMTVALTRFTVYTIRHNKALKTRDAMIRAIFNYIWDTEIRNSQGSLILSLPEKRCYLQSGLTNQLYEISSKDENFTSYLWYRYGILETEQVTKHTVSALKSYCRVLGRIREVRRFTFFDQKTEVLYVSNYDGSCWKVDGTGFEKVPNGSGNGIFIDDDGGVPVQDPVIGYHGKLLPTLVDGVQFVESTQGGMTRAQQRLALAVWIFAIAFPDLMPAKPMLLCEGEKGSGKSVLVQLVQRAVHGKQKTHQISKNDEKDFGVQILRSPICLLDNMDAFVDWLQDTLAAFTTGEGWTRRKLYTDDQEVEVKPQSFIAITSRNPMSFKRDDVADRCVILRLERREHNQALSLLFKKVYDERPALFGEWLWFLNEIVKLIHTGKLTEYAKNSPHRMADFAALAHVIGDVLGVSNDEVSEMLDAMQAERDVLVTEGDPLVDLLDRWLENQGNIGRQVIATDLHRDLSEIAKRYSRSFYKSPATLAQKLRAQTLQKQFDVRIVGQRGNAKVYEFRRLKEDR
jgi:hypothetical protein